MADEETPTTSRRSRTRLVVQGLLSLVLVVAIFYYLFKSSTQPRYGRRSPT